MAKFFFTTLFFLIIFISHSASSSSSHEIQPQKTSDSNASPSHYRVFYLKNTNNPLSTQEHIKKRKIRNSMKKHRQRQEKQMLKNNLNSRPFSVMLPKGFVPPSGSSPCHNKHPTSLRFHCHLSATKP